jgi:hypothetical protein
MMKRMEIHIADETLRHHRNMGILMLVGMLTDLALKFWARDESGVMRIAMWMTVSVVGFSMPWWRRRTLTRKACPECEANDLNFEPINKKAADVVKVRCGGCGVVCETDMLKRPWMIWERR